MVLYNYAFIYYYYKNINISLIYSNIHEAFIPLLCEVYADFRDNRFSG